MLKKTVWSIILLNLTIVFLIKSQDAVRYKSDSVHLFYIVNIVPNNYTKFLNGVVNIAKGNHEHIQIGIINFNQKNYKGFQLSCINVIGGNAAGVQLAFINSCFDTLKSTQIGLLNITNVNKGFQVGVINYSDTTYKNTSIGVISIIRKGGYQAIEVFLSEMFPVNVSYKIGLLAHGTLNFSSDSEFKDIYIGAGYSILKQLRSRWFFNPEFTLQSRIGKPANLLSVCPKLTFEIHKRIFISAGPSIVWNNSSSADLSTPLYSFLSKNSDNDRNKLVVGFRVGIRYNLTTVIKKHIKSIN